MDKAQVSSLRHSLRTSLNHILGFSEMLLEELPPKGDPTAERLQKVTGNARQILDLMQLHLPHSGMEESDLRKFRSLVDPPLREIITETGSMVQQGDSAMIMDLLRINKAASDLLAFSDGNVPQRDEPVALKQDRPSAAMTKPGHILLVDDDEANRDIFTHQLERVGHTVETAEDGRAALHLLRTGRFDLVLLDMIMPDMSGPVTLQEIKDTPEFADVPVIMLSAMDEADQVAICLHAGADDYLTKPSHIDLLTARVSASLERKRLRNLHRQREEELERMLDVTAQANRDLEQFAMAVSHDLQEPLRSMISYSQLLQRRYGAGMDADAQDFLKEISQSAVRMRTFVVDLLDFYRISAGPAGDDETLNLESPLRMALANLQSLIHETSADVCVPGLPTVTGSSAEYTQLFQNLIGNALKYRRPDIAPVIRVNAIQEENQWRISVADNGSGIEADYVEKIFAPFQRLHGPNIPGSGIGLAVCRRIVERRGGRIWVESPGLDQGSTFVFTLPQAAQA